MLQARFAEPRGKSMRVRGLRKGIVLPDFLENFGLEDV